MKKSHIFIICFICLLTDNIHCKTDTAIPAIFEVLDKNVTGLNFSNNLKPSRSFNMFNYMYFYNGAGLGAGDFNNDGLVDLFFASNQSQNRMFINTGNLKFSDITAAAQIPNDGGWSTGVSIIDINNDGLLDLYVCRVGNYETLKSKNQLLVCEKIVNGIPRYADKAKEYGLDFSGFSTQAAFLDYDLDGDLDIFLMNHSLRYNNTFQPREKYFNTYDSLSGDRMYRNNGISNSGSEKKGEIIFSDVTRECGILSTVIGYGLGITVSDINLDGWPDIYIANDFHENDYLYINQKDGTFKESLTEEIMHTSQFSMGVDVADVTNDAWPEIISLDMLPSDPYILKRSLGEDAYDLFYYKTSTGYNYQYSRNTLQLNRRNGLFSETGLYSGIYATDWSWGALWMDFDNDGWKDLFVSNGIPKRLNDIDYVNYVSYGEIQQKIRANQLEDRDMRIIDKFPQIKLPNKFFRNKGEALFEDMEKAIKGDVPTFSNGCVYADFDNDGDLDLAVNNIDESALIYRNTTNKNNEQRSLQIALRGESANVNAIGAKLVVFAGEQVRLYEKYPVRGFQSSMEIPLHAGLANAEIDSILLIWPDNTYQRLQLKNNTRITISYKNGLPEFQYSILTSRRQSMIKPLKDLSFSTGLLYKHSENSFVEFDREQLIPHMVSKEGPALAVADINEDGLDDVYIGSSKRNKSCVFLQQSLGKFQKSLQPALDNDSTYEEVDACWADVNNDTHVDLIVASGGNEYFGTSEYMLPRVYLNDGKANLSKLNSAFDSIYMTASCIVAYDFTGDGYVDLFVGGRTVPWEYGQTPVSYLLQNDKMGRFKDVTVQYSRDISKVGLVTDADWVDIDRDGDKDLILSLEWDGICAFINNKGSFSKKILTEKKGWWNFTLPFDADGDGDIDLIAGNLGLNSRLKASVDEPVKMYFSDFDGNGKKEQVLTYFLNGREIPFANKAELEKQMPVLKKKYLYAEDFAKASLEDLFGKENLNKANISTADYFSNAILINDGKMNFSVQAMPWEAQLTPYRDAIVVDANDDGLPDIFLAGNFYENNIQMGRYDADFGTILVNRGKGNFVCESTNGLHIKGQVRHIRKINIAGKLEAFLLARNNDSLSVVGFRK